MLKYLVSLASTNKIRCVILESNEEWDESRNGFIIKRTTFQYKGKRTFQPDIIVDKAKQKRTFKQQLELEFNSHLKKYLDKGYKEVKFDPDTLDEETIRKVIGTNVTNQEGVLKPMLAKQADKVSEKTFDKEYYGSRKINGTRCLIYYKDGVIKTASRGSINYDLALYHIINHPKLISLFKNHPDYILDGEIYKHGMTLNTISGICRSQSTVDDGKELEFYLYDIVILDMPFYQRYIVLDDIADELELKEFNPYMKWNDSDLKIQLVPHIEVHKWENIKKLHDEYVKEGWEGLVIREVNGLYGPGKRSNAMLKIKVYKDAEYPIVGWEPGLRDEDMCFVCETPNGYKFNVKPMGTREQKLEYIQNMDTIIGKNLTIKYFEMSGAGTDVPQQPVGICIRDYE